MFYTLRAAVIAMLLFMLSSTGIAQVTTNSGSGLAATYTSLANAITALNAATITGPVVITLSGNETAPLGGYVITATGTAVNTITIQGSSSTITAYTPQTSGGKVDAIFKIVGSDYVILQNFTLQENASNTTTTLASNNMTEFGVALFLTTATNGAQNNTVQNNTISLGSTYQNAIGIFSTSSNSYTAGTLAATSTAGTNSNNKFYANTINNVAYGMYFICEPVTATITESGNDIGGSSSATGNSITFGRATASDNNINRYSGAVSGGIVFRNGVGSSVKYNTITSNSASYAASSGVGGILVSSGTAPSGVTLTTSFSANTITLNQTGSTAISGIDFGHGISTCTLDASYNKITINQSRGAGVAAAITGIKANYASATNTMREDTITITQEISSGSSSGTIIGINGKAAGTTVTASKNVITIGQNTTGGTYGGTVYFIDCTANSGTVNIDSNAISSGASSVRSVLFCIYQDGAVTNIINIRGNTIAVSRTGGTGVTYGIAGVGDTAPYSVVTYNTISLTNVATASLAVGINSGGGNLTNTGNKSVSNNQITITGTGTGNFSGIIFYLGNVANVNDNIISLSSGGNGLTGISISSNTTATNVLRNSISLTSSSTGLSTVYGINSSGSSTMVIANNDINAVNGTGVITATAQIHGISSAAGTGAQIHSNTIRDFSIGASGSTGSITIAGITLGGGGATAIYKNKIYGLTTAGSGSSALAQGISISSGSTADTVYNNLIGGLSAPMVSSADAVRGISITSSTVNSTHYVYYNTIYLDATSTATNFGSSGIYHSASATATTSVLRMVNNIIVNASTPNGSGASVAFRRDAGSAGMLANYDAASNNNLFYAGTPSSTRLIYSDGTSTAQTISAYKAGAFTAGTIAPRDSNSISSNVSFTSTTGTNTGFLHLLVSSLTLNGTGIVIAGYTLDYDGDTRSGSAPEIGADEYTPQLAGTYTVPGDFATLALAVAALNAAPVSGTTSIDVAAGYTETLAAALRLTGTGTSANRITIRKSGGGANPLITAYTGGTAYLYSAAPDAIFTLSGSDYVTIDGIDLQDNAANTTAALQMEYGYALFRASTTDGCQYDTIRNCTVTLNRAINTGGSSTYSPSGITGIALLPNGYNSATTPMAPGSEAGRNRNVVFVANSIPNSHIGIALVGTKVAFPYTLGDTANVVGASGAGNSVLNYGGTLVTAIGVQLRAQFGSSVAYNTINNNSNGSGSTLASTSGYGVKLDSVSNASNSVTNNTITLTSSSTTTSLSTWGVHITSDNVASTGMGELRVENNTITTNHVGTNSAVLGGMYMDGEIAKVRLNYNTIACSTSSVANGIRGIEMDLRTDSLVEVSNNTLSVAVSGDSINGTIHPVAGIYIGYADSSASLTINNNTVSQITVNNTSGARGDISGIVTYANCRFRTVTISGNTIGAINAVSNPYTTTRVSGINVGISWPLNGVLTVTGNTITAGIAKTGSGSGSVYGIYSSTMSTTVSATYSGNVVANLSAAVGNSSTMYGMYAPARNSQLVIKNNSVSNLTHNGTGAVYGIYGYSILPGSYAGTDSVTGNTVSSVSGSGATIAGYWFDISNNLVVASNQAYSLFHTGSGSVLAGIYPYNTKKIFSSKNQVYGLTASGTSTLVYGIAFVASDSVYMDNNIIHGLYDTAATNNNAVVGIAAGSSVPLIASYNTVYLNAYSNSSTFGSSVVYMSITQPFLSRNNVFINASTPGGGTANAVSAVIRRLTTASATTTVTGSDRNCYYAGTPGAYRLIYFDGTNNLQTLAAYKAFMGGSKEANSVTELPPFINVASLPYNLHINSAATTALRGGGVAVTTPYAITTDYDGQTRDGSAPDIGADEFSFEGTLNLSLIPQGMYDVMNNQLSVRPQVKVYLAYTIAPYYIVDSVSLTVDSLTFTGTGAISNAASGNYYLVVKGNGILETWSRTGGEAYTSGGTITYDFTTAANKAYGDNQLLIGAKYCLYSGDVNGDGLVDLNDMLDIDNHNANFTGGYSSADLNMDGIVDLNDMIIADNNAGLFVGVQRPSAVVRGLPVKQRSE